MKKIEILYHIDLLMQTSIGEDKQALEVAKKAVSKEYKYKFFTYLVLTIMVAIIFGSFIAMAYFMYYR